MRTPRPEPRRDGEDGGPDLPRTPGRPTFDAAFEESLNVYDPKTTIMCVVITADRRIVADIFTLGEVPWPLAPLPPQ
jgi:hypothetical protein